MSIDLDTLHLTTGKHARRGDGVCLMEAVAWFAGQPHSDAPPCVSPVLRGYGIALNDRWDETARQKLIPVIPVVVGTAGDGLDEVRRYMALDWIVRTFAPTWLDLAGLTDAASELRGLRRIADLAAAVAAGPVVRAAREQAAAAWDAAWDAAGDAAGDAARDAARDAAWAAARAAAWAAAWDAAWDAAGDAAGDAARDAAWAAARAAAWAAAWDAAWDHLQPTVEQLQDSAVALFIAMAHPDVAA